ncbi:MAG: GGDEF domain-containing protein, partial [Actinomycetia bacterium]|nr:GGDEF domain-containing protein [Actinomycetes bacterium]
LILAALSAPLWFFVVKSLYDEVLHREKELHAQLAARRMDGQILRALNMAQDEAAALDAGKRTLQVILPENEAEILLADSSQAKLDTAVTSPGDVGPGCSVGTPAGCPAVRSGSPMQFESADAIDSCPHLRNRPQGSLSAACFPVNILGSSRGVLHVTGPNNQGPNQESVERLRMLGEALGTRISMLRALSDSELQASRDPLTGLFNRRSFDAAIDKLRANDDYAVVALDLDHFKEINDTYGHGIGDQAIRIFASAVQKATRESDTAARTGGEEFTILLPGANVSAAADLAQRIQLELSGLLSAGTVPSFTVSAGVADSTQASAAEEAIELADGALLQAKKAGRNCVKVAGVGSSEPTDSTDTPSLLDQNGRAGLNV